ncbi:MAG: hypothetical protein OEZ01_16690, partial [Candidatus Heimdallarchaeota archaeon]|nr:hypothetical protein [Candidatus Heimdallarchaeota archaeon]
MEKAGKSLLFGMAVSGALIVIFIAENGLRKTKETTPPGKEPALEYNEDAFYEAKSACLNFKDDWGMCSNQDSYCDQVVKYKNRILNKSANFPDDSVLIKQCVSAYETMFKNYKKARGVVGAIRESCEKFKGKGFEFLGTQIEKINELEEKLSEKNRELAKCKGTLEKDAKAVNAYFIRFPSKVFFVIFPMLLAILLWHIIYRLAVVLHLLNRWKNEMSWKSEDYALDYIYDMTFVFLSVKRGSLKIQFTFLLGIVLVFLVSPFISAYQVFLIEAGAETYKGFGQIFVGIGIFLAIVMNA